MRTHPFAVGGPVSVAQLCGEQQPKPTPLGPPFASGTPVYAVAPRASKGSGIRDCLRHPPIRPFTSRSDSMSAVNERVNISKSEESVRRSAAGKLAPRPWLAAQVSSRFFLVSPRIATPYFDRDLKGLSSSAESNARTDIVIRGQHPSISNISHLRASISVSVPRAAKHESLPMLSHVPTSFIRAISTIPYTSPKKHSSTQASSCNSGPSGPTPHPIRNYWPHKPQL